MVGTVQGDLVTPGRDPGDQVRLVAHDLAHHEDRPDHPPLLQVVEQGVGHRREAHLGRVVGPVVLQIEGEGDRAHGSAPSALRTPPTRWGHSQARENDDTRIMATSIGTR